MSKRMKKNNNGTKKKWTAGALAAVFLLIIGAGLYFLITGQDSEPSGAMKQASFAERNYAGSALAEIEEEEEIVTEEGTVEDLIEEEPEEKEQAEEPIEEESLAEAPKKDLSLMIANAKTHVYTIYTDLEQGSGFLFNSKGDILTNAHVVKDASYITLKNSNGQEFNGQVIGISDTTDIALVRVEDIAGKQPMEMEMSKVTAGTEVFALGSPENISNTSTEGKITAAGKSFFDVYQYNELYEMNAAIKQGSSGGPLIAADSGKILGINSIVLTDRPEIGYAIPIYTVIDQLNEWAANPIVYEEEEVVLQDVKDAYFDEALLRSFIEDFYELIPYSLNDREVGYYLFFLLPESPAVAAGKELVEGFAAEGRVFEAVSPKIISVEIGKKEAVIEAEAEFTYHDKESDKLESISHTGVYTVVIDEYGDYQITSIEQK